MKIKELLEKNKLVIISEICIILLPLYTSLFISDRLGMHHINIGGGFVLLGGPLVYLGLAVSLLLLCGVSRIRGVEWSSFGLSKPKNWFVTILKALGIALTIFGVVIFIINPLLKALPNLEPRDMSRFDVLIGNLPNLIINLIAMWITAGFLEEFLWRGYLMNRLMNLFGEHSIVRWLFVIVISSIIFGVGHAYQGTYGMIKTGAVGLVFAIAYLVVGRNLWPLVFAHALIDSIDFITHFLGG